ncbi:expressed unknown protein [Seminavis robusta]|uniref:Uncharacterized protein n=1 Tax=Seminavis robusta TaxID=568900 RepID=A0A9N8EZR0_9STRA|nr:expressed unknown protein [Seminavis robusta]|eukprot:Sro2255_g320960.1 n/a (227) ;mRNA; r:4896-5576
MMDATHGTSIVLQRADLSTRASHVCGAALAQGTSCDEVATLIEGFFLVVQDSDVTGPFRNLANAKEKLLQYTAGSRMIVEVRKGVVQNDPRTIAGQTQNPANGFSSKWDGPGDTQRMLDLAEQFLRSRSDEFSQDAGGPSYFVVVDNNAVTGTFTDLTKAKEQLAAIGFGSRLIAEVKEGVVQGDPHKIAGKHQTKANGFQKFWYDGDDINRMIGIAKEYVTPCSS